jgi:hypothetical protein
VLYPLPTPLAPKSLILKMCIFCRKLSLLSSRTHGQGISHMLFYKKIYLCLRSPFFFCFSLFLTLGHNPPYIHKTNKESEKVAKPREKHFTGNEKAWVRCQL